MGEIFSVFVGQDDFSAQGELLAQAAADTSGDDEVSILIERDEMRIKKSVMVWAE